MVMGDMADFMGEDGGQFVIIFGEVHQIVREDHRAVRQCHGVGTDGRRRAENHSQVFARYRHQERLEVGLQRLLPFLRQPRRFKPGAVQRGECGVANLLRYTVRERIGHRLGRPGHAPDKCGTSSRDGDDDRNQNQPQMIFQRVQQAIATPPPGLPAKLIYRGVVAGFEYAIVRQVEVAGSIANPR